MICHNTRRYLQLSSQAAVHTKSTGFADILREMDVIAFLYYFSEFRFKKIHSITLSKIYGEPVSAGSPELLNDIPDVQRTSECKDKTAENDRYRCPFHLTVLTVIKICAADLNKQRGEDQ